MHYYVLLRLTTNNIKYCNKCCTLHCFIARLLFLTRLLSTKHPKTLVSIADRFFLLTGQCHSGVCFNGGMCMGGYSQMCSCQGGFQGPRCQYGKSMVSLIIVHLLCVLFAHWVYPFLNKNCSVSFCVISPVTYS